MSNKLFSINARSEAILAFLQKNNQNMSAYINEAVLDEMLPVYTELRTEALYILDYAIDGAKEWKGGKIKISASLNELDIYIRQAIGRGITWMRKQHHIKSESITEDLIAFFYENSIVDTINVEDLHNTGKEDVENLKDKFNEMIPNEQCLWLTLKDVVMDIHKYWNLLWDMDEVYRIIELMVYKEDISVEKEDCFFAITILQCIENQYIMEILKENQQFL